MAFVVPVEIVSAISCKVNNDVGLQTMVLAEPRSS